MDATALFGKQLYLQSFTARLSFFTIRLRDVPEGFASFRINDSTRTPSQILAHVGDLIDWALCLVRREHIWKDAVPQPWEDEIARFFRVLQQFDDVLSSETPLLASPEKLFQGSIADALTHVGQIAMLRRLFGAPVRGENYFKAEISVGRVGPDQAKPNREFD